MRPSPGGPRVGSAEAAPVPPRPLQDATDAQLRAAAKQVWPVIQPMPDHLRKFLRLLSIEVTR